MPRPALPLCLLWLIALLAAAPAHAQTTEVVEIEGTWLKLIVPAGYCKVDRDTPGGRGFYRERLGQQKRISSVPLLVFVDCAALPAAEADQATLPMRVGLYVVGRSREGLVKRPVDRTVQEALGDMAAKIIGSATDGSGTSLLGIDENAVYSRIAPPPGAQGPTQLLFLTLLKDLMISGTLATLPEGPTPALEEAKALAAALVRQDPPTTEAVQVEGKSINLVIPAGYCKVTRETPRGNFSYLWREGAFGPQNKVLLVAGDCAEMQAIASGAAKAPIRSIGYFAPGYKDAAAATAALDRRSFIDFMVPVLRRLLEKDFSAQANEDLRPFGLAVRDLRPGTIGEDANAAYSGYTASIVLPDGSTRPALSVSFITLVGGTMIASVAQTAHEEKDTYVRLLDGQAALAAALVRANP